YGGKCNNDGSCLNCIANFEGDKCDVCVHGKYGELCEKNCVNEKCGCKNATDCISCKPRYFDINTFCSKRCSVGCRDNCENNGVCTCIPQYSGSTCEECKLGYYGDNCTTPCSNGCIDTTCKKDGTCQCIQNFSGSKCETCVVGHYGELCQYQCGGGCINNTCDRYYGTCECEFSYKGSLCNMCKDGYFGSSCNLSCSGSCYNCSSIENCFICKEGFYGLNCSYQCSANCLDSRCEKSYGFCTDGCLDGFTGATCSDKCDVICKTCSQTNYSHCTSCFGGLSGPSCKCIPNCQCELNSYVCNECTDGFEINSKDCKCNRNYCLNNSHCTSCQNNTFYTYNGTCCECHTHCKNKQCSSETHCLNGCEDGYTGEDCADLCKDYDTSCRKCSQIEHFCVNCEIGFSPNTESVCARQCNDTCFNKECDVNTGQCLQGCNERYWGQNYNHSCHPSCTSCLQENGTCTQCVNNSLISFGDYCAIQCSETCVNKLCDDTTGRCLQGCVRNFYADKCDLVCPSTCASEPNKTRCDNYGRCLHGCTEGYKGITCASATSTPKSDASVGRLIGGTVGENFIKTTPESESQRASRNPNPFTIEDQETHYQQLSDRHNTTARVQQLSDRHNTTTGVQDEAYIELQTNIMDYELLDI
ncbi:multiple epidermal growth factor-like domains protein 10, partial [Mya arenaria]|uniref:multiple epidermal growth factor-like domains protein 10 n=1 Tax=Mya arenaria TaxID=6604 RepID=UPI0022E7D750